MLRKAAASKLAEWHMKPEALEEGWEKRRAPQEGAF